MKKRLFCLAVMASILCAGLVPQGLATPIYTTLGPGNSFDTNDFVHFTAASPPGAYADEFTIPVSADVGSVSLALKGTGTILVPGSTVDVSIRTNLDRAGTGEGGIVGTFTALVGPGQAGIYSFDSATKVHLNTGTEYWLTAGTDGAAVDWFENDQGIDSNIASRSSGIWTVLGSEPALAFSINSVPEPGSFGLCAVTMVVAYAWRRRVVKAKNS